MSGKVIAITGASSGIGEAAARMLASQGHSVVLGARRMDRLTALAAEIADSGGDALAKELDVTSRDSMDAFIAATIDRHGRIDVLVNNAGIMVLTPWSDGRLDAWQRMFDVNVKGLLNGIAAAWPHMLAQQSGHMILLGSTSGHRVARMGGAYAATKFAIKAIAESLRLEGGTAIRSTLISPGATQTEIIDHVDDPVMKPILEAGRAAMLPVDAVARAIAYAIEQPPEVDVSEILLRPQSMKD